MPERLPIPRVKGHVSTLSLLSYEQNEICGICKDELGVNVDRPGKFVQSWTNEHVQLHRRKAVWFQCPSRFLSQINYPVFDFADLDLIDQAVNSAILIALRLYLQKQ